MKRLTIDAFLMERQGTLLVDVRSPAEYQQAHIPGAVNLPLFSNEERAVVGTAYKQQSREAAIKIGLAYFGPKMRPMVEEVEELISKPQIEVGRLQFAVSNNSTVMQPVSEEHQTINSANDQLQTANLKLLTPVFMYCWRGGMRSGAVSWLLETYGFSVTVLAGGYKAYRNHVLQTFTQPWPMKIIGGYTGSGKTEVLQQLKQEGQTVIDLEALAGHKGSAFGNIGLPPQPTQEAFENALATELNTILSQKENIDLSLPFRGTGGLWLEDESQRIGLINLPQAFWQQMRQAPVYFLDVPFEERLQHITDEYSQCDVQRLLDATERIKKRLGPQDTKAALEFLHDGNTKEAFRILLRYYDKHYLKGLHNRSELAGRLTTLPCPRVSAANAGALLLQSV